MLKKRTRLGARLKAIVVGMATAGAATAALLGPGAAAPALATGSEGFLFLQPGFTQTLWGTYPGSGVSLGGVAFATNGDVLADHCLVAGSSLTDYSQTSTTSLNGSTLHTHTELSSDAGCGLTNHPNGTLYTNTSDGVVNLNASTGAAIKGPFGPGGNALGIAADPLAPNNLVYVGSAGNSYNLFSVDAALTTSSTFSTADTTNFKDQITWSPDGQFLFISNRTPPFKLQIVNRSGALVQNVPMANEPDGIAFHAVAPQFVVTDNTDGTMTRFDFPGNDYTQPPVQTPFATGGFRGDMSAVGPDGCLYVAQAGTRYANGITTGENSILQICGGFAPPPGVGDASIAATGTTFSATEGQTFTGKVATVTDGDPNDMAAEYTVTIDWGDGSTSSGTLTGPNGGPYDVNGTHTYQQEGTYPVQVHITDTDSANTADATSTASVGDAALTSSCGMPPVTQQTYTGPTATFTDNNSFATISDFSATINWGDGTSSSGTITGGPGPGPYTVSGSHTYTSTGPFTVTTTITDDGGSTTIATCSGTVFAFGPGGGSFVIGDLESLSGTHVMFWGAQWWKDNSTSTNSKTPSFKGFAESPSTPSCGVGWNADPGNSTPPPAGPLPAFMAVIVTSSYSKAGSTISGDTFHIVIVKTDPGYQPNPGHPGTGTVVQQVC